MNSILVDKNRRFIEYRNGGDMEAHEMFLYSLVRGCKPRRLLEIGVRAGISTQAMTQAVVDSKVYCDYHICDIDETCRGVDLPIPFTFHNVSSDTLATQWNDNDSIDLLMIDGCHEFSQVKRDFDNFSKFVSIGGLILLHDTNPAEQDKHPNACWSAYKIIEVLRTYTPDIEFTTIPYSYGLTVVRKLNLIEKLHVMCSS